MKKRENMNPETPKKTGRPRGFKENFDNDDYGKGLRILLTCALALVLVVELNMMIGTLPDRLIKSSVNEPKVRDLRPETEMLLSELDREVDVLFACEKGEEYANAERMLGLYGGASEKLHIMKADPATEEETVAAYLDGETLANNSIIVSCGGRQQIIRYGDYYLDKVFVLEDYLNSAIRYVTADSLYRAYALAGREVKLSKELIAYLGLDGFEVSELDPGESGGIPSDCSVLIIPGLAGDLTADETQALLSYLEKGGGILLTTDYITQDTPNLDRLTGYFGAELGQGIVTENREDRFMEDNPYYILPTVYTDGTYALTDGVEACVLPVSMPILIDEELPSGVEAVTVLESSENSFVSVQNIFTGQAEVTQGPFSVAAAFRKGTDGAEGSLVWISNKQITNDSLDEYIDGGNFTFFLNSAVHLGKHDGTASIHGKTVSGRYLKIEPREADRIRNFMLFLLPALIVLTAVLVIIRRRKG